MISINGKKLISAYNLGYRCVAIFTSGIQVWPEEPLPSYYYIKWWPKDVSGSFNINGETYWLQDYNGFYSGSFTSARLPHSDVSTPKYAAIDSAAFRSTNITMVETNVEIIYPAAFADCPSLVYANLTNAKTLGLAPVTGNYMGVFENCSSLYRVSLPSCLWVGENTFNSCTRIMDIELPKCSRIHWRAFENCYNLISVSLPKCSGITGAYAFSGCSMLHEIDLPICSVIATSVFTNCSTFSAMYLGYSGVCSGFGLSNSPLGNGRGTIYVPLSLVSEYKSSYPGLASLFQPIPYNNN